ncbi:HAD family hydrolase [Streptomyces sp. NBC_00249]|uniref:HAD family hydrolase n=1 Tax=Streptomyces sp. NBC_00249 TaxID=2975690 RepID=UPI00224E4852|nr:HAD family hydrolase [Streptomyces sp. NBC_00249]MCX5198011.1 HAD family hydrolase [Streptomyces sp. NBC_00249]
MTQAGEVRAVLRGVESVFFDFDGPICRVFSGVSAADVARSLRHAYAEAQGSASLLSPGDDPLEVVKLASEHDLPAVTELEAMLTSLEVAAVDLADPTPHADEVIKALRNGSRRLAAVSNNSTSALQRYFATRGLDQYVAPLIGREPARLRQMKPDPHMVFLALDAHAVEPGRAVLIGDSVTDIQAARAAGVLSIGYANKPGKAEALTHAGATVVIEDMADLLNAI